MCYRIAIAFSMALLLNALNAAWPKSMETLKNPAFLKSDEIQVRRTPPHATARQAARTCR